uniref:Uncharacterized protein n=1 Tax=uncultured marine microorganism HF4000_010I05 TaxID=455517 RepID=B3T1J8_9ZZZZ|nr:hypothetical protein ALOHA_HF4000010I05ctg1g21 [uncultured marine microorganism HF4000_010I05]
MIRGAEIGLAVSMLLTTVATLLMLTGTVHAQRVPQHVFSGEVRNFRQPLNDGFVRVTVGPGQEVAYGDIRQGRYKIAVVEPAGGNYSGLMLRFIVVYQGGEYERSREVRWEAGRVTELNFDIDGWRWHQAPPQRPGDQPGGDDYGRQIQEGAEKMRREQKEREAELREKKQEERREMERQQIEREDERLREEMKQRREMERERMERGQPGVQPVAGQRPKSGPSRGLFSNKKSGEASSGIDNIMDPTTLTIIGIVLTVFTTGLTLFRGN